MKSVQGGEGKRAKSELRSRAVEAQHLSKHAASSPAHNLRILAPTCPAPQPPHSSPHSQAPMPLPLTSQLPEAHRVLVNEGNAAQRKVQPGRFTESSNRSVTTVTEALAESMAFFLTGSWGSTVAPVCSRGGGGDVGCFPSSIIISAGNFQVVLTHCTRLLIFESPAPVLFVLCSPQSPAQCAFRWPFSAHLAGSASIRGRQRSLPFV